MSTFRSRPIFLLLTCGAVHYGVIGEETTALEVIEVTAQKRVQPIQTVPLSITSLNGDTLAKMQVTQASSIADQVPNLNVSRSIGGAYNYFIRGIGMDDFNMSSIPAVGIYVDDIAIHNPMLANFSLLDIARIEVLRGPQNTLYGKNTTGGAINFISNIPQLGQEIDSNFALYTGSDNLMRLLANSHFSIADSSAMSISLLKERQSGRVSASHINNNSQFKNKDKVGFKLKLKTDVTDNINLMASFYGGKQREISEVKTLIYPISDPEHINIDDFDLQIIESSLLNPRNDADTLGGYFKLKWENAGYVISSISAFEDVETYRMDDWGSQSFASSVSHIITYNSTKTNAYSQEFQLLSPVDDDFNWLAGLLINKESGDILQTAYIDPAGPGRPDDAVDDAGVGPLFDRGAWTELDTLTYSLYGQINTALQAQTHFSAGLRWSVQNLSPTVNSAGMLMDSEQAPFPLGTFGWFSLGNQGFDITRDYAGFSVIENFISANNGFPASAKIDTKYHEWGGKIALSHHFDNKAIWYASIARGFKMGAVNSNPTTASYQLLLDNTVLPETLITYETGFKSEWFSRRIRINGAVFLNNWKDYQYYLVYNPGNPVDLFASLVNIPEAKTQGFEIEITGALTNNTALDLGIGYLDAKITDGNLDVSQIQQDFRNEFQDSVLTGNKLPNTPKWTLNATLKNVFSVFNAELETQLHFQFIDAHIHALAGNNSSVWQHNFSEQNVGLFNFSAQYTPGSYDNLSLQLWVKNIADEQYCSERATIPGTSSETVRLCVQGEFRELGVGFRMRF